MNFLTRDYRVTSFLVAALMATSIHAFAEEAADKQELVEVTGSHIKRVDTEGVSTIQTVTKQDIEKKGYDNLGEVVRDIGANSFGSATPSGNSTVPGNSDINLRGLGSDNTLVLLNGQRLPQDAITGTVDINLIPMAAIERIEILKDGASAIYGSDALGGVVNIITKKDFKGTQMSISESLPTNLSGGKKTNVSAVNGFNSEKLNIVTSLNYTHDDAIASKDRPWSNRDGKSYFSAFGSPGSYLDETSGATKFSASSNCDASRKFTDSAGNTRCYFKYSDFSEEMPKVNEVGGLTEAHYDLNSNVKLNARLNVVRRTVETIAAPAPGELEVTSGSWASQSGLSGVANGDTLLVLLRTQALGPRITDYTTSSYGSLLGTTIQLPHDWQMDINASYSLVNSHSEGVNGWALSDTVSSLISSGAYNPFAPNGSQGDVSSATYHPTEDTTTMLSSLEASASGAIAQVGAGDVNLAIGTVINYSSYSDQSDAATIAGSVLGNAGSSGAGHRTSEAFYSELSVPVVEKKLDLQVAGRYDHFSDFGSTVNPKLGVLYHASPSLLLRSTVGTGFRAPLLTELYAGQSTGVQSFIDQYACNKLGGDYCQAKQYNVTSGSNSALKQETSTSVTFGTVYQPTRDFDIGLDWFYTNIKNIPGIDLHDMTVAQAQGIDVTKYGLVVPRNADGTLNQDKSIFAPLLNLAGVKEMGVDITPSYTWNKFKFSTKQNQLFYYKTANFPGLTAVDELGWNGLPKWRNTTTVSYFPHQGQTASLSARTIPHQLTLDKGGYVSSTTTFDLSYVYKTKKIGEFSLAVINVLNTDPPLDASNPQSMVNYSLYDPNGRQIVLAYKTNL